MTVVDTRETRLGKAIAPLLAAHPRHSGIHSLRDAHDAFAARVLLAQTAERTLDIQYYIWRKDMTGTLLFEAVRAAADRGVRVRLLLDDNNTSGSIRRLLRSTPIRASRFAYLTHSAFAPRAGLVMSPISFD